MKDNSHSGTSIQNALQAQHNGSLRHLRDTLGVSVSIATLGRILAGEPVSPASMRQVKKALRLPQPPSWQRRKELRAACAALGLTVEDAAELWLSCGRTKESK